MKLDILYLLLPATVSFFCICVLKSLVRLILILIFVCFFLRIPIRIKDGFCQILRTIEMQELPNEIIPLLKLLYIWIPFFFFLLKKVRQTYAVPHLDASGVLEA